MAGQIRLDSVGGAEATEGEITDARRLCQGRLKDAAHLLFHRDAPLLGTLPEAPKGCLIQAAHADVSHGPLEIYQTAIGWASPGIGHQSRSRASRHELP